MEDGRPTVRALGVSNTRSPLQAVTAGTAAAVPSARPHTGETAGVTPEERSTESEQVNPSHKNPDHTHTKHTHRKNN